MCSSDLRGSNSELTSGVSRENAQVLMADDRVLRRADGRPLASPEIVVVASLPRKDGQHSVDEDSEERPSEARLVVDKPEHEKRCEAMGIKDIRKIYTSADLASGKRIVFAATGVTDGTLMKGVRFFGDGIRTTSLVMQTNPHQLRFIDSIHVTNTGKDVRVQF